MSGFPHFTVTTNTNNHESFTDLKMDGRHHMFSIMTHLKFQHYFLFLNPIEFAVIHIWLWFGSVVNILV